MVKDLCAKYESVDNTNIYLYLVTRYLYLVTIYLYLVTLYHILRWLNRDGCDI
jgi:hypothetical protein